ncbi:hypothetical protein ACQY0O_003314 [Thecaphora frezii]
MATGDPVHKGTLVCVVLKAKNLPNKRSIGKQDPYCVLTMGSEQQRTKPDKRGGQHPTWDEQLHFEIYEDMEDALVKRSDGSKTSSSAARAKGGKKVLKVSCYADDNKDPEFIGEGMVDLTDTLKTGEFDEWVPIKAKERYAGEVYLELTFYSAAAPPKRKKAIKPVVSGNDTYGGAGTFHDINDLGEPPVAPPKTSSSNADTSSSMRLGSGAESNGHRSQLSGSVSVSHLSSHRPLSGMSHSTTLSDIPASLRPSSSMAHIDAYTPPYAPPSIGRAASPAPSVPAGHAAADGYSEFGQHRDRRSSFAGTGHESGIVPSTSYYGHSAAPSHATITHHAGGLDRYGTASSFSTASSYSQLPTSSTTSHLSSYNVRPDPADQLSRSMSMMSFQQPGIDRPLGPPTPTPPTTGATPPQSQIYQHPSQIPNPYPGQHPPLPPAPVQTPQPPQPPQPQYSYTPQPSHAHLPTPPPQPASAPPLHADYGLGSGHYGGGGHEELQRPVSPAARPPSSLSTYSSAPPSVINAQTYYQAGLQPAAHHHLPPRSVSPALSTSTSMSLPVGPTYQTGAGTAPVQYGSVGAASDSNLPMRRAPRPLPSTQPMAQQQQQQQAQAAYAPIQYAASGSTMTPSQSWKQVAPPPPTATVSQPPNLMAAGGYAAPPMSHSYSQTWSQTAPAPAPAPALSSPHSVGGHLGQHPPVPYAQPGAQPQWTVPTYPSYDPATTPQPYAQTPPQPPLDQPPQGMTSTTSYPSHLYGQYAPTH